MKKILLLASASYLSAQGMDEEALSSITLEAIMFLGLFISLYIVSYFVSQKQAKKFEEENPLEMRRQKLELRKKHESAMQLRSDELSKLFAQKIINDREFKVLQNNLDYIVKQAG